MTAPKPMNAWQAANLPESLPLHIRRNITPGDGGCWLWTRSRSRDGYGWASYQDKTYEAHRLVYRLTHGGVPDGKVIDHLCRVRHCVNPDHLEAVTPGENLRRSELTPAGAKACVKGHPFEQWNGQRRCRTCREEYAKAHRAGRMWESRRPWTRGKQSWPASSVSTGR
ncbi:HNH endonuclease signature motif containing protein [Nesterenkonia sp.]|uniref:HNH endonuclease signature motif containing protein n=1 Tax=Nesterenkonia sp. TaxID=704201 RepID=UPI00345583E4